MKFEKFNQKLKPTQHMIWYCIHISTANSTRKLL